MKNEPFLEWWWQRPLFRYICYHPLDLQCKVNSEKTRSISQVDSRNRDLSKSKGREQKDAVKPETIEAIN